jgi:hypothetical protein
MFGFPKPARVTRIKVFDLLQQPETIEQEINDFLFGHPDIISEEKVYVPPEFDRDGDGGTTIISPARQLKMFYYRERS